MQNKRKDLKKSNRNYYHTYPKIVSLSFFIIILIGTALLMLPISVKQGTVGFFDALFTAVSATCVTGLIQFDTFTKWTLFGQLVILCMIQIGGLGFITLITVLTRFVKKKVSIKQKILLKESMGAIFTGDLKKLGRTVIGGTVLFEILGAAVLCTQFIPSMGLKNGLYTSVFLSVSAFCNAGFDVMGRIEAGSSLITVNSNPVILITISLLIIIGGIGFLVWNDFIENKFRFKKYNLHSKLTLSATAVLLVLGTIIYFALERNNTLGNMHAGDKLLNSFFASATTRTAGFNSVPVADMTNASKMLTYVLMFIGGSSGSTAGGIKTSTITVLVLCILTIIKNSDSVECFGKRITDEYIRKATAIFFINFSVVLITSITIAIIQPSLDYFDILFECVSAMGTVGMTTGITPALCLAAKIIITALMFIGRVTSLIFVFMFHFENRAKSTQKPQGDLLVG